MNIIYGKFNILKKKKIFYYLIRLLTKIYRRKKERKGKKIYPANCYIQIANVYP